MMEGNKRYLFVFIFLLLIGLIISYNSLSNVAHIEFQEAEGFTLKLDIPKRITDEEDIKFIKNTIRKSKKVPGIVDVADPNYVITINHNEYYVWVTEGVEKGAIMKTSETHTLYTISSGPQILEILKSY